MGGNVPPANNLPLDVSTAEIWFCYKKYVWNVFSDDTLR